MNQDYRKGEIVIYKAADGPQIDVHMEKDSVWLTQKQMSVLFDKDTDTIGLHLKNIYKEKELEELATTEVSSVVQIEGNRQINRKMRLYNLDAIISVGYRINSKRGTQFRIWATNVLRLQVGVGCEYLRFLRKVSQNVMPLKQRER